MTEKDLARKGRSFDLRQLELFLRRWRVRAGSRARRKTLGCRSPRCPNKSTNWEQGAGRGSVRACSAAGLNLPRRCAALLPRVRALIEEAAALPQYMDAAREGVRGPLRVGVIPTILPYLLAPVLREFMNRYPEVEFQLRESTTEDLVQQVLDGALDLAVVSVPVAEAGLVMSELFREPLMPGGVRRGMSWLRRGKCNCGVCWASGC